jgi:hypothetical protein
MFVSFILQIMHICFMREEVSSLSIVQRVDALFSEEDKKKKQQIYCIALGVILFLRRNNA